MAQNEKHTLSSVIHMTRKLGKTPCLRDAMAVVDRNNLNFGGPVTAKAASMAPTPPATAGSGTSLAPGPMELGAISAAQRNSGQCARCKVYGHWSPVSRPRPSCPVTRSSPGGPLVVRCAEGLLIEWVQGLALGHDCFHACVCMCARTQPQHIVLM